LKIGMVGCGMVGSVSAFAHPLTVQAGDYADLAGAERVVEHSFNSSFNL
jgi:hypothetical protein